MTSRPSSPMSTTFIRSGRVKVVLIGEDGREVILGVLNQGEHFGELSLIDEMPRSAHVIAMEDATLIVLKREDFRRRIDSSPAVAWSLLAELSRRLRRADEMIGGLVLLDGSRRIAPLLVCFAHQAGGATDEKGVRHQTIAPMDRARPATA